MAPARRGAHEEESIFRRTDGHDPASDATIYAWRKHFGQMEAADVKRLKALELENSRLKKLLAERDLDLEILKEINAKKW